MIFPWQSDAWSQWQSRRSALPHALLLTGVEGIGKAHLARVFGQALLCAAPRPDGLPCGHCNACHWIGQGSHPDFRVVQPESAETPPEGEPVKETKASRQIRIEQVRALQSWVAVGAHQGGWRVGIVVPAEAMNVASANALLKTLEEPPARTLLILVAHDPARLLPTIRSRCQRILASRPDRSAALEWLRGRGSDASEATLALAGGAPLLAAEHPERFALAGVLSAELSGASFDPVSAAAKLQGAQAAEVLDLLLKWSHDLTQSAAGLPVRYYLGYETEVGRAARSLDPRAAIRFYRRLLAARRLAEHPLNVRAVLEDLLIDYHQMRRTSTHG